jgi:SAM-dependent methyltransferase
MIFSTEQESHAHSVETINELSNHYDFMSSIKNLLDIGCGKKCLDLQAWTSVTYEDDEGNVIPFSINCTGLDKNPTDTLHNKKIKTVEFDFNSGKDLELYETFDVVWCHDVMQYSYSPINFLGFVNKRMNKNGLLYLCVPSTVSNKYNKFSNYTKTNYYNTFTLTQLIYLLALNGFDCKDAYFKKDPYVDIIEVITYKNSLPLDYNLNFYQLDEMGIFNESMSRLIFSNGYLDSIGLITSWINGRIYDFKNID